MTSTAKLITFDVTNTLIRAATSVGTQYSKLGVEYGFKLNPSEVDKNFKRVFQQQNTLYPSYGYHSTMSGQDWWVDLIKKLLKASHVTHDEHKLNNFAHHAYSEFKKARYWDKYENCEYVLQLLKSNKYKLGVISNFDDRLATILKNLHLNRFFDFVLIPSSCDGYSKPHSDIFLKAYSLGLTHDTTRKPEHYLHIGDSIDKDYKPARSLGFKSILMIHDDFNKTHTINEDTVELNRIKGENAYANDLVDLYEKITKSF